MSGIRKGEAWGRAPTAPADVAVEGSDAALAAVAAARPGARVAFHPDATSDLARSLGLHDAERRPAGLEVPIDGIDLDHGPGLALNAVVLGTPPDRMRAWSRARQVVVSVDGRERFDGRAVAVVIVSGQFLRGVDLVPRGHPGDGRLEIQVYALRRGERRGMRHRLPPGDHLPHPRIHQFSGRRVEARFEGRPAPLEADGVACRPVGGVTAEVIPAALWILI